jgi:lysozyme family protein
VSDVWRAAIDTLQRVEGGYVNHPDDPGGETNFGISKRAYPDLNIAMLTKSQAAAIAKRDYWDKVPDTLSDELRWMAFDAAFHHGIGRALQWLQFESTLEGYTARRIAFMAGLETFNTFGRGWMRRVATVLQDIASYKRTRGESGVARTVVLHDLTIADRLGLVAANPIVLRERFLWRSRGEKLDVRKLNE